MLLLFLLISISWVYAQDIPETWVTALDRSEQFFTENGEDIELESFLVYSYLQRKFSLEPIGFDLGKAKDEAGQSALKPFLRLLDGGIYLNQDSLEARSSRIDKFTLQALYCDQFSVNDNFVSTLQEYVEMPGYYATHSLIAIQWMRENQCSLAQNPTVINAEMKAVKQLAEFCENSNEIYDKYVEAVAILIYSGHRVAVKDAWINRIVAVQQSDGGWMRNSIDKESSFHTSVMALWVLEEITENQKSKNEEWIID